MAKPLKDITKTDLSKYYNLVKVYDGASLMKSLSTIKPNHFYAEYKPKKDNLDPPAWFKHWSEEVYEKKQPAWFKHWTENVYEKKQPQWFKDWNETEFKPLKADVETLKTDVENIYDILERNNIH